MSRYTATAERTPDDRVRVTVTDHEPQFASDRKVWTYSRVGNIDGSAHFMLDGGGWTFLPHGNDAKCEAVYAAERELIARERA